MAESLSCVLFQMGTELKCLFVCCLYHVMMAGVTNQGDVPRDLSDDVTDDYVGEDPYTESPVNPYRRGPPSVALIIVDVQVSRHRL